MDIKDSEYLNTDATVEEVKALIRAAKVIMQRPLPLTHAKPEIALVGYKEEESRRYKLLKEIRIFQTGKLFASLAPMDGHVSLIVLPFMTKEEYEMVDLNDLPDYRVYETDIVDDNKGKGR